MIKFTTQELEMEKSLKQRIEFICEFCHVTPTITNGSIKRIMEGMPSSKEKELTKLSKNFNLSIFTETYLS